MPLPRQLFSALIIPVAIALGPAYPARMAAAQSSPAGERTPAGRVGLDQLLKLPQSLDFDVERKGGRTRLEWRALFEEAQRSIDVAKAELADAQARHAKVAGRSDNWTMAPPGLPVEAADDNPDTRALREEIARWRAEVIRAEARQREINIEASLAGVPEDWRSASVAKGADGAEAPARERTP